MVEDEADLRVQSSQLFAASDLLIAQEFMPTSFDWRVGVLNREPLFAAKYFMAKDHWQIIRRDPVSGQVRYGGGVVLPLEEMPRQGLDLAVQAANLVGDGLYGVDLKQVGDRWVVIEVNDNPSIDYEVEDGILKGELYRRVMTVFLSRIEALKNARTPR
jgi:glutathione synthase/RimK-type ligase-like ATP-grasp enzyme